jgi:hypothetical protein
MRIDCATNYPVTASTQSERRVNINLTALPPIESVDPGATTLILTGPIWNSCYPDSALEPYLDRLTNLQKVSCTWCDGITGAFIRTLPQTVRVLEIGMCRTLKESELAGLSHLTALEELSLKNYISREDGWFGLPQLVITGDFIGSLPASLRTLSLIQFDLDDASLKPLSRLFQLRSLTVQWAPRLTRGFFPDLPYSIQKRDYTGCSKISA